MFLWYYDIEEDNYSLVVVNNRYDYLPTLFCLDQAARCRRPSSDRAAPARRRRLECYLRSLIRSLLFFPPLRHRHLHDQRSNNISNELIITLVRAIFDLFLAADSSFQKARHCKHNDPNVFFIRYVVLLDLVLLFIFIIFSILFLRCCAA